MASGSPTPRVVDNDRDEITVTLAGKEIRGWSYADEAERRVKMLAAREFVEGWYHAAVRIAELEAETRAAAIGEALRLRDEAERGRWRAEVEAAKLREALEQIENDVIVDDNLDFVLSEPAQIARAALANDFGGHNGRGR